ncbi:MAG: hypothetical protein Tsb0020_19120 [Haliangiales bacterium]
MTNAADGSVVLPTGEDLAVEVAVSEVAEDVALESEEPPLSELDPLVETTQDPEDIVDVLAWPIESGTEICECQTWDRLVQNLLIAARPTLGGLLEASDPREARRQRIARLEADIARLRQELQAVPDAADIVRAVEVSRELADIARSVCESVPERIRIQDLRGFAQILHAHRGGLTQTLPTWTLGVDLEGEEALAQVFADPTLQAQLCALLVWLECRFASAPPHWLRNLTSITNAGNAVERLEAAYDRERELRDLAKELPEACRVYLRNLPHEHRGVEIAHLHQWHQALGPEAFGDLVARLGEQNRCPDSGNLARLPAKKRKFIAYCPKFAEAEELIEQFAGDPENAAPSTPSLPVPSPSSATILDFAHAVTDESSHVIAAPLTIPPIQPNDIGARIEVPVRLYANNPIRDSVEISIQSPSLRGVPSAMVLPEELCLHTVAGKVELQWTLRGASDRWRQASNGRYEREEIIAVPMTLGTANRYRQEQGGEFSITLSTGVASKTLTFTRVLPELPALRAAGIRGDASATDLVRNHPLGAQIQHQKLEGAVENGRQSFMCVAPRRFGKTTLFLHLADHAEKQGHMVVRVTLERDLATDKSIARVWEEIILGLEKRYDAAPALGGALPSSLFDENAWERVRAFLAQKGCDALVVLVDEAQALVPRSGGVRWGNQFKNVIERLLGQPSRGRARVQIGLFGTVDLALRIGQNCRDFLLMPGTQQYAFDEASLQRYLRTIEQGRIESSRAARIELARWANNLRTLSEVFGKIRTRLQNQHRVFMLDTDVLESVQEMLNTHGKEIDAIWSYARAELSHSDEWNPIDAFPLAVAWAQAEGESLPATERLDQCTEWLNQELLRLDRVTSATITRERTEAALRELKHRGILRDDGEFYRPFVRELIRRKRDILIREIDSQLALLRLAVDQVTLPEGLQKRAEGGQARILVEDRGERTIAYRVCDLEHDRQSKRFARTCAALRLLRDPRTAVEGDEHLPRISRAGFQVDNPERGIIAYDWVPGEPLEECWSDLDVRARGYVVLQVARAIRALHARGVLHCDVAPRNIVVDTRLKATLIDFGLARRLDSASRTQLSPDPFKAPEQVCANPKPCEASDVYALGILLRGPDTSATNPDPKLAPLIETMLASNTQERPSAAEVVNTLNELLEFEPYLYEQKREVEDVIQDAPDWLWEEMLQFESAAAAARAGLTLRSEQRLMEAAFLLNKLFATIVSKCKSEHAIRLAQLPTKNKNELSLAAVRSLVLERSAPDREALQPWLQPEVYAVGLLRIAYVHPTARRESLTTACQELRLLTKQPLNGFAQALRKVAGMLDELLETSHDPITRYIAMFL